MGAEEGTGGWGLHMQSTGTRLGTHSDLQVTWTHVASRQGWREGTPVSPSRPGSDPLAPRLPPQPVPPHPGLDLDPGHEAPWRQQLASHGCHVGQCHRKLGSGQPGAHEFLVVPLNTLQGGVDHSFREVERCPEVQRVPLRLGAGPEPLGRDCDACARPTPVTQSYPHPAPTRSVRKLGSLHPKCCQGQEFNE